MIIGGIIMKLINLNEINSSTISVESIPVGQCFKFENEIYMLCSIGSFSLMEKLINDVGVFGDNLLATSITSGNIYLMKCDTPVIPVEVESTWKFKRGT
jgi:hypothetical protein